jgi:glycosyltransferase involved in cell wall biosynthesis
MGRLHSDKAHDVSLKALAQTPYAYLWIAGDGPLEGELKTLAKRLGVRDRVRFLGWRLDASALYRTADICLFPSRFEPLGNTVIQAWAHDIPLVTAASQGPGAIVRDEVDALLTPVEDVDAVAKALNRLIADKDLGRRLVEGGRERIATEYAVDTVVAEWRTLFARFGEG